MIPFRDNHPTRHRPWLTWGIIGACVLVFTLQNLSPLGFERLVDMYGVVPAYTVGHALDPHGLHTGWQTLFTSLFMHADLTHLAGNMLYLFVFGDNIENALYRTGGFLAGRGRFAAFYILGGVLAALGDALLTPTSTTPMIGASGAISAVLGAYLVLYPRQRITVFLPYVGFTELAAYWVLGGWFVYQLLHGMMANPAGGGGIAFWAHIAGFAAGALLILPFGGRTRPRLWG